MLGYIFMLVFIVLGTTQCAQGNLAIGVSLYLVSAIFYLGAQLYLRTTHISRLTQAIGEAIKHAGETLSAEKEG